MCTLILTIAALMGEVAPRASWYESGTTMANGERFNPDDPVVAHRELPFGTRVRITNLENLKRAEGVVKDRGPFIEGRDWDLSRGLAQELDFIDDGVVPVIVEVLEE